MKTIDDFLVGDHVLFNGTMTGYVTGEYYDYGINDRVIVTAAVEEHLNKVYYVDPKECIKIS